jgi:hypothetical protein
VSYHKQVHVKQEITIASILHGLPQWDVFGINPGKRLFFYDFS